MSDQSKTIDSPRLNRKLAAVRTIVMLHLQDGPCTKGELRDHLKARTMTTMLTSQHAWVMVTHMISEGTIIAEGDALRLV